MKILVPVCIFFLIRERKENVTDVVHIGDVLQIKYLGMYPKTRKEKVSRKALLQRPPREERKE